ncbi:hypothetical protein ACE1SV_26730 [Streptomyces sennicomposti]
MACRTCGIPTDMDEKVAVRGARGTSGGRPCAHVRGRGRARGHRRTDRAHGLTAWRTVRMGSPPARPYAWGHRRADRTAAPAVR